MNNIKIENNYKLLKDNLDENIKEVRILDDNKRDIYFLLKIISIELLENYFSNKFNYIKNKSQFNTTLEPLMITINYFDNIIKKQNIFYIYNNFEIIEKNIMKLFFDSYVNNSYLYDCFFEKGKIIINLPNNLNNKTISLVGSLDNYYNYFALEYIFIYNNDKDRINHFNIILGRLEKYLANLKFNKNNAPITLRENSNIIGTAIKYGKDNDNDNAIIPDSLKENFESCPHIGLQNIGATCYMNSTLQCFCHIEKFVEFFKYNPQATNIIKNEKDKLSSSFKLLIDNLWPDNFNPSSHKFKKYYSPEDFKNKISKMTSLFEGIESNNAKDLINLIILFLHLELNININIKVNENQINGIIDQTNKKLVFQTFKKEFTKKHNSIISKLFYAINYNKIQCCNCNKCAYIFQIYFLINFPLEEVIKYKIEKINHQENVYYKNSKLKNIQNNKYLDKINIFGCFDYEEKVNYCEGENKIYCNYCKTISDCYMKTNLYTGPEILILILNREKGIEFNIKIYFTEELNLSKYIRNIENGYNYKLISVITYLGENSMSEHFIAYCKDPLNGNWYKYNDAIVDEVKDFKKEVIDFAMPYLLFYQKKSN